MSFLGKILVVLQLAASLVFMCFAAGVYSSHAKWRAKADSLSATLKKTQGELSTAQADALAARQAAEKAVNDTKQEIATLTKDVADAKADAEAAKTRESQRLTELAKAIEQTTISGDEAEARRLETLILRELNKAQGESRAQLASDLNKTQDELKSVKLNLEAAAARNSALIRQTAQMTQILNRHKISTENLDAGDAPPPPVDAIVLDTQPAKGAGGSELVTISLGADDRLRKGHVMTVYRSSQQTGGSPKYLGKIEIIRTMPDKAVGIVVERAGNGTLQKGDKVTTKL